MSKWKSFVSRLMAMAVLPIIAGNKEPGLVVTRLPRVPDTLKPRPAGMATEYERNIKPRRKGKGTRKQRKQEQIRLRRRMVSLAFFYSWQMERAMGIEALMIESTGDVVLRYGSKAHRRALAKLTQ